MSTVIQLLLDKEGFPNNHLPVLVVRQNDVKFRSGGCLERRQLTVWLTVGTTVTLSQIPNAGNLRRNAETLSGILAR